MGSRTTRERGARGEGISVYRVDLGSGQLELVQTVADLVNPSFLALNKARSRLYTVHGDGHEVSVLAVDPATGRLRLLQRQVCGGLNPVHLALDPTDRFLVVSDHLGQQGGTLAVMGIDDGGCLLNVHQRVHLPGEPGPHRKEQPFSKPHFSPFDPTGQFVVVPDKGLDRVFSFRFDAGHLAPAVHPWMQAREGAGPRHIAFHPTLHWAYVVNELDSSVTACQFDLDSGRLQPLQIVSSLPDRFTGNSRASEIQVSADGRRVYASNRGCDGIAMFDVEQSTGRLSWKGSVASAGKTPRFFTTTPDRRWMYVLNEDSDAIVVFAICQDTGLLTPTGRVVACGSPVCMVFSSPALPQAPPSTG